MQKYGYSPASNAGVVYAAPIITNELSHTPLGPSALVPDVDVCAAESLLANVTIPPTPMVTVEGKKQSGSHPGVEEPIAFSTVVFMLCSANALGAAYSPIAKVKIIDKISIFFVFTIQIIY